MKFTTDMMARAYPKADNGNGADPAKPTLTIRAYRGNTSSSAKVYLSEEYSNKFLAEEDMETFIDEQLADDVPVVYTLTGRLATSINRLHDFSVLPIGVESNSDDACTLTFSVPNAAIPSQPRTTVPPTPRTPNPCLSEFALYDAELQTLTPIADNMQLRVPGRTQDRFFIVTGLQEQAEATSAISVFSASGKVHVVSAGEVIDEVRVFNAAGQLVYANRPGLHRHVVALPKALYVVKAKAGKDSCVRKLVVQ